jgi:hypothetical protein
VFAKQKKKESPEHNYCGGVVAATGGWMGGFKSWFCLIYLNDLYNNEVGKGECGFMKLMK